MLTTDEVVSDQTGVQRFSSIGLSRIVRLLRFLAGDPQLADRATIIGSPVTVDDVTPQNIVDAQDLSQDFSIAVLQFTAASAAGYFNCTGSVPTPTGSRGIEIPAGGGTLTIRGTWNIRNFSVIASTGTTMVFTALLYKTSVWSSGTLRENN